MTDKQPAARASEAVMKALSERIAYILDPSASATDRMHRRAHLTDHDLRTLRDAIDRALNHSEAVLGVGEPVAAPDTAALVSALERLADAYKLLCDETGQHYYRSPSSYHARALHLLAQHKGTEHG